MDGAGEWSFREIGSPSVDNGESNIWELNRSWSSDIWESLTELASDLESSSSGLASIMVIFEDKLLVSCLVPWYCWYGGGWREGPGRFDDGNAFRDLERDWSSLIRASTSIVCTTCSESVGNNARTVYDASSCV